MKRDAPVAIDTRARSVSCAERCGAGKLKPAGAGCSGEL